MEYRRTRRSVRKSRQPFDRSVFVVACVSLILIYAISFSKIGTWTAKNLIAPIIKIIEKDEVETLAQGTGDCATERFQIPKVSVHALQFGIFSDLTNAEKQAISLRSMGAAGFVKKDGEKYRVLGASYLNEADARQVRDRLRTQGLDCIVYPLEAPQCEMLLSGTDLRIDAVKNAVETVAAIVEDLTAQSISFDAETASVDDMIASISAHQIKINELASELEEVDGDAPLIGNVRTLLTDIEEKLDMGVSMREQSKPENSSFLKYLTLETVQLYCDFCSLILQSGQ